jgi:hypothetical protein
MATRKGCHLFFFYVSLPGNILIYEYMKRYTWIIGLGMLATIALLATAYSGDNADYPGGAPAGYTGSPFDGKNCTTCHGGTATNVDGWITSNVPGTGYVPGGNYIITVTVTGNGKKGFEVSPQDASGNLLGTIVAGTGSQLTGGGKYITHTASINNSPAVWTFNWIAPPAGTGDVTFYGAFALSLSNTRLSTMTVSESTVGINDNGTAAIQGTVSPNPTSGKVTLALGNINPGTVNIRVLNASGSVIQTNSFMVNGSSWSTPLDLTGQAAGLYFIETRTGNSVKTMKLILTGAE